jgi:tetratricopeptide (TPR) repeat protein
VLEGSVRRAGNRIRITAQLINVESGYHLWSERYDRELNDVFAVQDEIASAIARKLEVALSAAGGERQARPATEHLEAYELYLKGRYILEQRTEERMWRALASFEESAKVDPEFAPAHTGIADALSLLSLYGLVRPHDVMPRARAAAERAIALNDSLPEAHNALAFALWSYAWDWRGALREYDRALALSPNNSIALTYLAFYLKICVLDEVDEGFRLLRRAVEVDPLGMVPPLMMGVAGTYTFRGDEVLPFIETMLARNPDAWLASRAMGITLHSQGKLPEALRWLERAVEGSGRSSWALMDHALALVAAGDTTRAEALTRELEERSRSKYVQHLGLSAMTAALGRTEEALQHLERAFEERDGILIVIRKWPAMDSLRSHSRYHEIIRRMGFPPAPSG